MRTGFYPGSFDPVTFGHLDIIARCARIVDKLVLGVGTHASKQALLDPNHRIGLLESGDKAGGGAQRPQNRDCHL